MTRLLFASTNPGKIREVRQVLEPLGFEVVGLDSVGTDLAEPHEDGDTFEANALIKARACVAATGLPAVAVHDTEVGAPDLLGALLSSFLFRRVV